MDYKVPRKLVGPPDPKGCDQQYKVQLGLSRVNIGAKAVNRSVFTDDASSERVVESMEG